VKFEGELRSLKLENWKLETGKLVAGNWKLEAPLQLATDYSGL
jgi:hypothetical protein